MGWEVDQCGESGQCTRASVLHTWLTVPLRAMTSPAQNVGTGQTSVMSSSVAVIRPCCQHSGTGTGAEGRDRAGRAGLWGEGLGSKGVVDMGEGREKAGWGYGHGQGCRWAEGVPSEGQGGPRVGERRQGRVRWAEHGMGREKGSPV